MSERCKRGCSDRDAARCWPLGTVCKGPCSCACHPKPDLLTPSEVALAKVLAAWDAWPGSAQASEARDTVYDLRAPLAKRGMIGPSTDDLSAAGRALLDRARKAGVL